MYKTSKSVLSLVDELSEILFLPLECSFYVCSSTMHSTVYNYTYSSHKESTWPVGFQGSPTYVEAMSLGGSWWRCLMDRPTTWNHHRYTRYRAHPCVTSTTRRWLEYDRKYVAILLLHRWFESSVNSIESITIPAVLHVRWFPYIYCVVLRQMSVPFSRFNIVSRIHIPLDDL